MHARRRKKHAVCSQSASFESGDFEGKNSRIQIKKVCIKKISNELN